MRKRLLLIIALGTAIAVAGAGTALSLESATNITLQTATGGTLPACTDLVDNDGDGKTDLQDTDCSGPLDTSERAPSGGGTGGGGGGGGDTGGGGGGNTGPGTGGGGDNKQPAKHVTTAPHKKRSWGKGGVRAPGRGTTEQATRDEDGSPTNANPGLTIAPQFTAPANIPNYVLSQYEIPPFLLPIYQACGTEYGIAWQILAAIHDVETDFSRTATLVSPAGAVGHMQFIPSSWRRYGVDANNDGRKDPYNLVDSICAAGNYLRAAGGMSHLRDAIFAYNHADWYVDLVIATANRFSKLPESLVGSLTGLAAAMFPIPEKARYADDVAEREQALRSGAELPAAIANPPIERGINVYSRVNAPVVAVNDGVIEKIGKNDRLGKFVVLRDGYGNRFTYALLDSVARVHPVAKERELTANDFRLVRPKAEAPPSQPASADDSPVDAPTAKAKASRRSGPVNTEDLRQRLFALPRRPNNVDSAGLSGQLDAVLGKRVPAYETFKAYFSKVSKFDRKTMELRRLKEGSRVTRGTILGRIGRSRPGGASYLHFAIRPAGRGAPSINPKEILDGWKQYEATAIFAREGKGSLDSGASISQVLLMSKAALESRVLADPRLEIYACGRRDIKTGQIDRRTLATMEYLAERGYRLTVTSLKCGHSYFTTSGNVSAHSSGNALDIARVNGMPILGNQGPGSITDAVVRDLLAVQGPMRCAQIISLMDLSAPESFAMADHDDHIHCGFTPTAASRSLGEQVASVLKPKQWAQLLDRLAQIEEPKVPVKPSKYSIPTRPRRASDAHIGE